MRQNSSLSNHSAKSRSLVGCIITVTALLSLCGCSSISYYTQAVRGHLDLSGRKQDIDQLLADPETEEPLRTRLHTVKDIRQFAIEELALPDSGSYTSYADLEREVTVWLLSAAPELSLEPKQWCYLLVGCLSYRGYFHIDKAEKLAARLQKKGFDTSISPSLAYSTLGLMKDPVLNTMLVHEDAELAAILFHEMAHELTYVKGDSMFSESFASAVERVGRERWLAAAGKAPDRERQSLQRERASQFNGLLLETRGRLERLFGSDLDESGKRSGKQQIYADLDQRYANLKADWNGYTGYDHWMAKRPNNADLSLVATYELAVPAFLALLAQHNNDLPAFYAAVETLSSLPPKEREARLAELTQWAESDLMNGR
jgi:predicted aminopeptidase